ncbi:DNA polymerase III subunit beta [Gudongella oleilytica]|uniref:DNA polymerase III subunit beta n=1 Tax=Gudongella oleilytica TaxID=1582259 RepID=UPI002A369A97|nr:DNA polymerase III subunit beta [Gudongella oleilytica]MDY0257556.1 DNA polymerase III subunit beta [Gudongella oleilytica]
MKFRVEQRDLSKHIGIAQRGISSRSTLQILDGILFEAKDHSLKLTATDLEISIETFVDAVVGEKGKIVLNSRIIGDIVRKLPDDTIAFEVKDNQVNIKCQNAEFNIIGNSGDDYPDLPIIIEENQFSITRDLFKSAIRQTVFATTQDETRPSLTGVLMELDGGNISCVSLDGYRLALRKITTSSLIKEKIIIPGRALNELNKIIEDKEEEMVVSISHGQAIFNLGDTIMYTKLLEGQFFNYKDIMRAEHKTEVRVSRRSFQSGLERASLLAKEEKANLIKISVSDGQIAIKSNSEMGDVFESVNANQKGEDLNIAFNSRYILEGIKIMDCEEIVLKFVGSLNPCIINGVDDDSYTYLVLPVRLAQDDF